MTENTLDLGRMTWDALNARAFEAYWTVFKRQAKEPGDTRFDYKHQHADSDTKPGDIQFIRLKTLRTRYYVTIAEVRGRLMMFMPTKTEIRYHKPTRRWLVLIDGEPVNSGYKFLRSAKAAVQTCPLERLAAEGEPRVEPHMTTQTP